MGTLTALSLGLGTPGGASAQPTDAERAAAKQAFEEGLELEKQADYSAALAKFQKVGEFKMTPHVRFHVALCEEKLGQLVSAMRGFELAAAEALKMGKDAQVVADKAPERAEALRKRIAAVRIEVKGKVLHSRILLDGQPVLAKDFNTLVPVDPGKHAIEVETDGAIAQRREVTLAEKGYETITLELDDKERPLVATVTATATSAPTSSAAPPPPPPSRLPAFVLGGAGVASLIGAGVFYGLRFGAIGQFEELCPVAKFPKDDSGNQDCPPSAQAPHDDAQMFTVVAGVLTGVGVAALGGAGAYWLLTQRKPANGQPTKAPATTIGVSVSPTGLRVLGSF